MSRNHEKVLQEPFEIEKLNMGVTVASLYQSIQKNPISHSSAYLKVWSDVSKMIRHCKVIV